MTDQFKVSIYMRVSTSKQANEGDSLDEQEKELKKFCEYKNYLIHKTHIEAGRSAKDTNRPEYQRLMRDIEAGKINAVVVKKLDRLSRSLLDFEGFMVTAQKHNVEFISLKENFDTTTAMGKAMLRVALVFAQLEREQTAERISDVMTYRAEQGLRNGGVSPFGYDCIDKELVPHRQHKKIIELIFDRFIETKSTVEVAKTLNEAGYRNRAGKEWDCRRIYKIIQNETYIGKLLWGNNIYEGVHQPLISEKKFAIANQIFKDNQNIHQKSKINAILQKLLVCGSCSCAMSPSHSLNHSGSKYYYYRCLSTKTTTGKRHKPCAYKQANMAVLDKRVINLLFSLTQSSNFHPLENSILKYNQTIEHDVQKTQAEITSLEAQQDLLSAKKEKYLDSLIAQQFLSSERQKINQMLEELELQEKQLKAKLYKLQFELSQKADEAIEISSFKEQLIAFRKDYDTLSQSQIKASLLKMIKEIIYYPNKLTIQFSILPWPVEFEC